MLLNETQTSSIQLTTAAADAVRELLEKKDLKNHALRVFVSGGGCSGFQYGMALENNILENDLVFDQHGVKVVIDEVSISYLQGASIDYVDELMGSGFKIENPNAVASCGCGSSFRTKDEAGTAGGCGSC
ncbi:MAG: iron-sulfur cluster insertion protein ErpA [Anaerolineales bacterium]|nr:iron-sulfur cluster insertion protein ErpA [Anaerolineales bacterium]